jgi:hypothetical protein
VAPTHRPLVRFFASWLAIVAIAWSVPRTAFAALSTDRVVLVHTPVEDGGWEEAEQRTRAELEAAGFLVEVVPLLPGTDIIGLARARGAFAAVKVSRPVDETTGIVVHVVDRVTGKSTTRMLDAKKDGQTPERVAIRAVELLYASLLELQTSTPFEGDVRPTPHIEATAAQRMLTPSENPGWALRLGASAFAAPGGIGTLAGIHLGVGYYVLPKLSLEVSVAASAPTIISTTDASSDFGLLFARTGMLFEPWPKSQLSPALGLGAGIAGAFTRGSSQRGAPTRTDLGSSPFAGLSGAVAGRLRRDLRLRAEIDVARTYEPLVVRFAGDPVARFGPTWVGVTFGLEWLAN